MEANQCITLQRVWLSLIYTDNRKYRRTYNGLPSLRECVIRLSQKFKKVLNQTVKRNINRFPDDFMFQLTKDEWNVLRPQIVTAKLLPKIRILPYATPETILNLINKNKDANNHHCLK